MFEESDKIKIKEYLMDKVDFEIFLIEEYGVVSLRENMEIKDSILKAMELTDPSTYSST